MSDIIKTITDTPIPTLLVIAGIVFLLLSVADKVSAHLVIPETRKKQALILGVVMLGAGIALSFQPVAPVQETAADMAPETPAVDAPAAIDWEAMSWSTMTAEHRGDWALLGWTAEAWENGPSPDTDGKAFGALSTAEQGAVTALGFTPAQWDSR